LANQDRIVGDTLRARSGNGKGGEKRGCEYAGVVDDVKIVFGN
jgi:hypothetical protein